MNDKKNGCNVQTGFGKFPLAPMGVLAPGSAHAGPYAQSHKRFQNPRITLSRRKVSVGENRREKKQEKKVPLKVDTSVIAHSSRSEQLNVA